MLTPHLMSALAGAALAVAVVCIGWLFWFLHRRPS
jgi:hypothetical protein